MVYATAYLKDPDNEGWIGRSYVAPNRTAVTAFSISGNEGGEVFSLYRPKHKTLMQDGLYPTYVYTNNSGLATSTAQLANTDKAQAITSINGHLYDLLEAGFQVVVGQVVPALALMDGTGGYPTVSGRGLWNPPGETGRPYELLTNALSDVTQMIQHLRFFAKRYKIGTIGVGGDSGAAVTWSWLLFGPDRAGELGSGGVYDMPTHPSWAILDRLAIFHWGVLSQGAVGLPVPFPTAVGGNTQANAYNAAAGGGAGSTRYLDRTSILGFSPMLGKRCPPTLMRIGTAPATKSIGIPLVTGAPETTVIHSGFHGYALRQALKDFRLYPTAAIATSTFETGGTKVYYDGTIDNLNSATAGDTTNAVAFALEHQNDPIIYTRADREDWYWEGQVETTGRFILPENPNREYADITCIDSANDLLIGNADKQSGSTLEDIASTGIHTKRIFGPARVYARAAANTSAFGIFEKIKGK